MDLAGKIVLLTGCGGGIGAATSELLVAQGATLIATDLGSAGEPLAAKCGGRYLSLDVTSEQSWQEALTAVETEHGALHGLVNNAGVILYKPLLETTLDDYRRLNAINNEGVFLGMRTFTPLLAQTQSEHGSSIVNLSSIYGLGGQPGFAAYCASKGAVRLVTKAAALEFAQNGWAIRANSLHPGPIDTPLARGPIEEAVKLGLIPSVAVGLNAMAGAYPHGRLGSAEDVAQVIAFLLSDASRFVNGVELAVDDAISARA